MVATAGRGKTVLGRAMARRRREMTGNVQELPRGDVLRAWTIGLEVLVGLWVLCLFLVAAAWDPIDRRFGSRSQRIAQRLASRPAPRQSGDAYAILPAV